MYDVHDDGDAVLVGSIYERLQLLWCTETAGSSEERAYMISEGAIVGVLLYGHDLYAVVAVSNDAWQHILLELGISSYLLGVL